MFARSLTLACALALAPTGAAWAEEPPAADAPTPAATQEQLDFFEQHIRPLLAAHCYQCHGSQKQEYGLRLDSREGALRGSDNGPVIVPGDPDASRLLEAVGYRNADLQMPPDGKLPDEEIAALREWIAAGAAWPDDGIAGSQHAETWRSHWAFQPVRQPPLPPVSDPAWCATPVDAFVLARLDAAGLSPSPEADRRTLIRRLSFDLLGLPPTWEEVQTFERDTSADAYAQLVERLLASEHYGERWGRHWLDVARYADSKGYKFFGSNLSFGYTYRDWVVRAFNADLPYDQFVARQLAADRLVTADDNRDLAALGYLTVGRRFLEDQPDIIDDRIDVVSRGLLGLTVTCARCHDHKFDPIPTADYYSLYGVFAASVERTRSLRVASQQSEAHRAYEQELVLRQTTLDDYFARRHAELKTEFRARTAEYLLAGQKARSGPPRDRFMFVEVPGQLAEIVIERWRVYLDYTARGHDPVFAPWHALAALSEEEFAGQAPALCAQFAAGGTAEAPINPLVAPLFDPPPANLDELAQRYAALLADVDRQWHALQVEAVATRQNLPEALPDADREQLRRVLYGPIAPPDVPPSDVEFLVGRPGQAEINALRGKLEEWERQAPAGYQRAMTLEDSDELARSNPYVFVRGKASNFGPEVPRQFLAALAGEGRRPFEQGSGRLELAQAIASPENPLTARVLVNRVWGWHFGTGLVGTPSDFGLRSETPTHPELLDWLAAQFVADGWSLKSLHRQIVLSATYRQASHVRPECAAADPDNRLLWRANRRRLDLEAMRDALLAASGRLDRTVGGFAVDLATPRRTIYAYIDRGALPGMLRTFDFANPDTHAPQRFSTTVPQQALYLLNSPFVLEQARALAARPEVTAQADPAARIARLYEAALGRAPTEEEVELGRQFVEAPRGPAGSPITPWEEFAQALLLTNEFVFVD
jgi:hypothetical protein